MGRLFGTDGVRGVANRDLTPELAFQLGRAGAAVLAGSGGRTRVLIGRDTRVSGEMLEAALAAGIASVGADVVLLGIIPTPGVAYLTRALRADAAAMISASHNPVPDNGIKFFAGDGFKLPDAVEDEIERLIGAPGDELPRPTGTAVGRMREEPDAWRRYAEFLRATAPESLKGLRIVVDCAFGAAYQVAPTVLRELGAEVVALHDAPRGERINVRCGSTDPRPLQEAVREHRADLGLAHDGDADRVIAVDERGEVVDGDHLMAVCALARLAEGTLPKKAIAATVYSNLGLRKALREAGGEVVVTPNGDRYVLEAMRREGLAIGGEQSGHIIFLEHNTTGDGILTALQVLGIMVRSGRSLGALAAQMEKYPQILANVPVAAKDRLAESAAVQEAVAAAEEKLAGRGRIFVRASGTENLVRVMAEGPDAGELKRIVDEVSAVVERELG
ncbi:MAG: phosphoglucosamine mutase [Bacteroidota bacterium]